MERISKADAALPDTAVTMPPTALQCLQQIYARDYRRLCTVAQMAVGDEHLAQDAVQEAWLRLSRPETLSGLDTGDADKLRRLVIVAVRNTAHDLRRKHTRVDIPGENAFSALPDRAATTEENAERREAVSRLKAALRQLEETDRNILLLQYDNGCTGRQIAALLGMREAAVRKRAERAKKRLKAMLLQAEKEDI